MNELQNIGIFGGSGYIGSFLIRTLCERTDIGIIYILDIKEPRKEIWNATVLEKEQIGDLKYQYCDVRNKIDLHFKVDRIYNFAAIHREPGHKPFEYFETNIRGAENITEYATKVGCNKIIFTSSIAPYGSAEQERTEMSMTVPYSPYGSSKLIAEKIHEIWLEKNRLNKLIIVRPGVIFGPWEDGNVPRMRDAIKNNLFFYSGNKKTKKAGGYIKELILSIVWVEENNEKNKILYNFSFPTPPRIEEYVNAIKKTLKIKNTVYAMPYSLLYLTSVVINIFARTFRINNPAHPERVKKLLVNNLISPKYLIDNNYKFHYELETAIDDWKKETPEEWQ